MGSPFYAHSRVPANWRYDTTAFCMAHNAAAALVDTPIFVYTC